MRLKAGVLGVAASISLLIIGSKPRARRSIRMHEGRVLYRPLQDRTGRQRC